MKLGRLLRNFVWNRRLKRALGVSVLSTVEFPIAVTFLERFYLEDYTYLGPESFIDSRGTFTLGRGSIVGPRLRVYTCNHRFRDADSLPYDKEWDCKGVIIGENVWIGGDVILLPGSVINEGAIIGAGSVVHGTIESCGIYAGNPARKIGMRDVDKYNILKSEDALYQKWKNSN